MKQKWKKVNNLHERAGMKRDGRNRYKHTLCFVRRAQWRLNPTHTHTNRCMYNKMTNQPKASAVRLSLGNGSSTWEQVQTSTSHSPPFHSPTDSHTQQATLSMAHLHHSSHHSFPHNRPALLSVARLNVTVLHLLTGGRGGHLLRLSAFQHRPVETWWMRLHAQVLHVQSYVLWKRTKTVIRISVVSDPDTQRCSQTKTKAKQCGWLHVDLITQRLLNLHCSWTKSSLH